MQNLVNPDYVDLNSISVGEAMADGSFTYTDGESPSCTLKLIVNGAYESYPAYMAVVQYLRNNYWSGTYENGYIAAYDLPLDSIQLSRLGCDYAYSAECVFQYRTSDSTDSADGSSGSSNRRNANDRGTTSNNPSINNADFEMPDIQASDFSYSSIGGSSHLTTAYSTRTYLTDANGTAIDYQNGIGYNGETFDGVDVASPSESFSVTLSAPSYWLNTYYRNLITECTGCTNLYPFWGYAPECVLFKGLSASSVTLDYTDAYGNSVRDWYWRLRYEFEARQGVVIPAPDGKTWNIVGTDPDVATIQDKQASLKTSALAFISSTEFDTLTNALLDNNNDWAQVNAIARTYHWSIQRTSAVATYARNWASLQQHLNKMNAGLYKAGFRYLWFAPPEASVNTDGVKIPVLKQANLARVYPVVDFDNLMLPALSDAD